MTAPAPERIAVKLGGRYRDRNGQEHNIASRITEQWFGGEPRSIFTDGDRLRWDENGKRDPDAHSHRDLVEAVWEPALPPPAPAPGWRIRPLEWRGPFCGFYEADTLGGVIKIMADYSPRRYILHPMTDQRRPFDTLEEAQAAAQADFAARIASCLEPAPDARSERIAEAARDEGQQGAFDPAAIQRGRVETLEAEQARDRAELNRLHFRAEAAEAQVAAHEAVIRALPDPEIWEGPKAWREGIRRGREQALEAIALSRLAGGGGAGEGGN